MKSFFLASFLVAGSFSAIASQVPESIIQKHKPLLDNNVCNKEMAGTLQLIVRHHFPVRTVAYFVPCLQYSSGLSYRGYIEEESEVKEITILSYDNLTKNVFPTLEIFDPELSSSEPHFGSMKINAKDNCGQVSYTRIIEAEPKGYEIKTYEITHKPECDGKGDGPYYWPVVFKNY